MDKLLTQQQKGELPNPLLKPLQCSMTDCTRCFLRPLFQLLADKGENLSHLLLQAINLSLHLDDLLI